MQIIHCEIIHFTNMYILLKKTKLKKLIQLNLYYFIITTLSIFISNSILFLKRYSIVILVLKNLNNLYNYIKRIINFFSRAIT